MSVESNGVPAGTTKKYLDKGMLNGVVGGIEKGMTDVVAEMITRSVRYTILNPFGQLITGSVTAARNRIVGDPVVKDANKIVDLFGSNCGRVDTDAKAKQATLEAILRMRHNDPTLYQSYMQRFIQCVHHKTVE